MVGTAVSFAHVHGVYNVNCLPAFTLLWWYLWISCQSCADGHPLFADWIYLQVHELPLCLLDASFDLLMLKAPSVLLLKPRILVRSSFLLKHLQPSLIVCARYQTIYLIISDSCPWIKSWIPSSLAGQYNHFWTNPEWFFLPRSARDFLLDYVFEIVPIPRVWRWLKSYRMLPTPV